MKMNKSFQILVAILVLVGSASATSSDDEVSPRSASIQTSKKLCLEYLKDRLANCIVPADIARVVEQLREKTPGVLDNYHDYLTEIALQSYEGPVPESCPRFAEFLREIERRNPHIVWYHDFDYVTKRILGAFRMDTHISEIFFAKLVCDRLAVLEIVKREFQSLYGELLRSYTEVEITQDVANLSNGQLEKSVIPELLETCPEVVEAVKKVDEQVTATFCESEEKVLFQNIVYDKLMKNDHVKLVYRARDSCVQLLRESEEGTFKNVGGPSA